MEKLRHLIPQEVKGSKLEIAVDQLESCLDGGGGGGGDSEVKESLQRLVSQLDCLAVAVSIQQRDLQEIALLLCTLATELASHSGGGGGGVESEHLLVSLLEMVSKLLAVSWQTLEAVLLSACSSEEQQEEEEEGPGCEEVCLALLAVSLLCGTRWLHSAVTTSATCSVGVTASVSAAGVVSEEKGKGNEWRRKVTLRLREHRLLAGLFALSMALHVWPSEDCLHVRTVSAQRLLQPNRHEQLALLLHRRRHQHLQGQKREIDPDCASLPNAWWVLPAACLAPSSSSSSSSLFSSSPSSYEQSMHQAMEALLLLVEPENDKVWRQNLHSLAVVELAKWWDKCTQRLSSSSSSSSSSSALSLRFNRYCALAVLTQLKRNYSAVTSLQATVWTCLVPMAMQLIDQHTADGQLLGLQLLYALTLQSSSSTIEGMLAWIGPKLLASHRVYEHPLAIVLSSRLLQTWGSLSGGQHVAVVVLLQRLLSEEISELLKEFNTSRAWVRLTLLSMPLSWMEDEALACHLQGLIDVVIHALNLHHLPCQRVALRSLHLLLLRAAEKIHYRGMEICTELFRTFAFAERIVSPQPLCKVVDTSLGSADQAKEVQAAIRTCWQLLDPVAGEWEKHISLGLERKDAKFLLNCLTLMRTQDS
eukprot:gene2534-2775_t